MSSDPVHSARSRHALTVRRYGGESDEAQATKRELVAAKLVREILSATTEVPTITVDQRQQIASLLLTTPVVGAQ